MVYEAFQLAGSLPESRSNTRRELAIVAGKCRSRGFRGGACTELRGEIGHPGTWRFQAVGHPKEGESAFRPAAGAAGLPSPDSHRRSTQDAHLSNRLAGQ